MAFLRCTDAIKNENRDIPLRKPLVTLGRADGADVVLADPTLAPLHANLLRRGNQFNLSVLDRNAWFFVDGEKARSCDLRVGEQVIVGRFVLTLMEGEVRAPEPAPATSGKPLDAVDSLQRLVTFSQSELSV